MIPHEYGEPIAAIRELAGHVAVDGEDRAERGNAL
jgi:hypothetical protein